MPNPNDPVEIGDAIADTLARFDIIATGCSITFRQGTGMTEYNIDIDARRDHDGAPKRRPVVPLSGRRNPPDPAA